MTQGQWSALLFGPFAVLFGVGFIVFRRQISVAAREQRQQRHERNPRWNPPVGPMTQPPWAMAAIGGVFVLAGLFLLLGSFLGWIH